MKNKGKTIQKTEKKDRKELIQCINLQLSSLGQPLYTKETDAGTKLSNEKFITLTEGLISSFREKSRLLSNHLSPVDTRIQNFINDYFKDLKLDKPLRLPNSTFVL